MMNNISNDRLYLRGLGTAVITPFNEDMSVDYETLRSLIERQIEEDADFLVILGTTAETPTLSEEEQDKIIELAVEVNRGRVPLVAGISHNGTLRALERLQTMPRKGVDAALVVCPYYNKPSQEGLYQHFRTLSENSPIPILMYNVPARTSVNMLPETTIRIAEDCPNIIGIKEASGIVSQIDLVIKRKPSNFCVLAGDDTITLPILALGGDGVISVIGNAFPKKFGEMVRTMLTKPERVKDALEIHHYFKELYPLLFAEGNPAGVKCLMHQLGLIKEVLRLPLVPVSESREQMRDVLKEMNVLD
ncbi:MAG: 4-hydroxy-tetrahydrodipicolinate synthase [Porphyromonas sp.]|nr:4-hydroxy-tetrahydrodipicolinate synthase [Porphyromonas sp.]